MEERPIEEIVAEDRREMYRLNEVSHVGHNVHAEKDRCIVSVRRQIAMGLDPRAEPFVQRAGLLPVERLTERWFKIVQSADPGPTVDFIQWWILVARRYLVLADRFHHLLPDEIPVEATQRQSGPHPARPDVPHVPDNKRPGRRMMVGTRTTARDWQWLDDIMDEDAPAAPPTQKNRRMPVSYACRRGAGRPRRGGRAGRGSGEGGDAAPTQQLRAMPAPVSRYRRRGQAHRLTSYRPLKPRGPRSRRP
ncbi:hypothetical protein PIB30_026109 [Stylosanthes scabra]|uniref:Uncharacterized protein n=1 Tax=Stylosanthes scabra TaxID=79078 RepID=A0ABU6TBE1_9FABA|nr:hypothetical protein [Stylosanthes scabra]